MKVALALFGLLASQASADMYMQNGAGRGSNNRLDDQNRDRNNANRLFDSQNNNRGGYNVGKLSMYEGEIVPIGWSNQHSSGLYQLRNVEFIIQYACDELMRDGESQTTIPITPTNCAMYDCDRDVEYGRHESMADYMYCRASSRNKGLFIANRNLKGKAAYYTRQNPDGTRFGYECPEERDYYPYWRPTIWKDIAVITNQPQRCDDYQAESQNVKDRWACVYNDLYWDTVLMGYVSNSRRGELALTEEECDTTKMWTHTETNTTHPKYEWRRFPAWGIDPPACQMAKTTRVNHHGLAGTRSYYTFQWTIPEKIGDDADYSCCVIRARYNITTKDYEAWASDSTLEVGTDYTSNSNVSNPDPDDDPAWVRIWENFGLSFSDVVNDFDGNRNDEDSYRSRGYVFVNNPRVDPFGHMWTYDSTNSLQARIRLQLAINTNQFGRTFQDRTHCFQILDRPSDIDESKTIKLLTVQGKRGNIVQVYPATEYFFVPEPLEVMPGDYIHFCWTGSNTNPNNNDGQGKQGTDRSNICPLTDQQYSKEGYSNIDGNVEEFEAGAVGDLGNNYPDYVKEPTYGIPEYYKYANKRGVTKSRMAGLDIDVLSDLCTQRRIDDDGLLDYGNMEELDDAGTSVCHRPVQAQAKGIWNFLSTRNNNFSNRSQKGTLIVSDSVANSIEATSLGGMFQSGSGEAVLVVQANMVEEGDTLEVDIRTWMNYGGESSIVEVTGPDGGQFSAETLGASGWLELWIPYTPKALNAPAAYYRPTPDAEWQENNFGASIAYEDETHYGVTSISRGGYYKIVNEIDVTAVIFVLVGLGAFAGALAFVMYHKCRKQ